MTTRYSDDELIGHLRALADELGESPTAAQMDAHGAVSSTTCARRFGSWNDALRAAGLAVNRERNIPVAALVAEIHRLRERLDRVPMAVDVQEHGAYSLDPYVARFDSWTDALAAAGFSVRRSTGDQQSNVAFLRERGPCRVDDLPDGPIGTDDKLDGVATFEVGDGRVAVAYLLDVHDETAVVSAFLAANPSLLSEEARHNLVQLFGGQGRRWRRAARPVLDELLAERRRRNEDM